MRIRIKLQDKTLKRAQGTDMYSHFVINISDTKALYEDRKSGFRLLYGSV